MERVLETQLEARVRAYWTVRADDFALVRRNELRDDISGRWLGEFARLIPMDGGLRILDAGTGAGYFAILLAGLGHRVTGIDFTPAMIEKAREMSASAGVRVEFEIMDAQALSFPDGAFDAVVSRNLTWTLPEPERAYAEWLRVLRPGGVMINFDACYGRNVRSEARDEARVPPNAAYGHYGVTEELARENAEITLSMPINSLPRPEWDLRVLRGLGCLDCGADLSAGTRVLGERDLAEAPLFAVWAVK